jgi:hypothetical protein
MLNDILIFYIFIALGSFLRLPWNFRLIGLEYFSRFLATTYAMKLILEENIFYVLMAK